MPDIFHDFPILAPAQAVFAGVSTPAGLDQWWTERSSGRAQRGAEYGLWFGPNYDWAARVTECVPLEKFELQIIKADRDWEGTKVGFALSAIDGGGTQVRFQHTGWPHLNDHYRISCYCWAMYLRILKRYLEHGETVPYAKRLDV
jgi:uncharacterized protein YndB with AHSA1/START domain